MGFRQPNIVVKLDEVETKWRRSGDDVETKWRRSGDDVETTWRRRGDGHAYLETLTPRLQSMRLGTFDILMRANSLIL